MKIEYPENYFSRKAPKARPYPVNGGNVERLAWEENHARCVAHHNYPVNGGKVERLAWKAAHGWDD